MANNWDLSNPPKSGGAKKVFDYLKPLWESDDERFRLQYMAWNRRGQYSNPLTPRYFVKLQTISIAIETVEGLKQFSLDEIRNYKRFGYGENILYTD